MGEEYCSGSNCDEEKGSMMIMANAAATVSISKLLVLLFPKM
jgi:hypothetical protein